MNFMKSRIARSSALIALLSIIGFNVWARRGDSQNSALPARVIPPEGIIENDTGGKVPGNPANAEGDFEKIYIAIQNYRTKHDGKYPKGVSEILNGLTNGAKFSNMEEAKQAVENENNMFLNPDSKYSDDPVARKRPNDSMEYNVYNTRPDGTLVGDPPPGSKDVLASTALYYHQNVRRFKGQKSTSNPAGFYIVLWNDGTIQKIAYDKILYVPKGGGDFTHAFPGQAGVPDNALTYDEFYRAAGWIKGPRGEVGGKGSSFKGKAF